jgi:7-cyano-7-deazaguanine synthase
MTKSIVLLSGGVDSVTCLYWAINQGYEVIALSLNYTTRPKQEQKTAERIAQFCGIKYIEADISFLKSIEDLLKEQFPGNFEGIEDQGYIPAKNLIFYSIASYFAEIFGAEYIIGGHIAHDGEIFPDANRNFFNEFEKLLANSLVVLTKPAPKILTPLISMTKKEVGEYARTIGVPLDMTWSCSQDNLHQCGKCYSCKERKLAVIK